MTGLIIAILFLFDSVPTCDTPAGAFGFHENETTIFYEVPFGLWGVNDCAKQPVDVTVHNQYRGGRTLRMRLYCCDKRAGVVVYAAPKLRKPNTIKKLNQYRKQ